MRTAKKHFLRLCRLSMTILAVPVVFTVDAPDCSRFCAFGGDGSLETGFTPIIGLPGVNKCKITDALIEGRICNGRRHAITGLPVWGYHDVSRPVFPPAPHQVTETRFFMVGSPG
jgi:hypothetical protein